MTNDTTIQSNVSFYKMNNPRENFVDLKTVLSSLDILTLPLSSPRQIHLRYHSKI